MKVSYGLKGGLGPMFIRVVTVSRMEILGSIIHPKIHEICESGGGKEWLGTQIWSDLLRWDRGVLL